MYLLTRHVTQVSRYHLYMKHDVPVLQAVVGAHLEHVSLLRLPVEGLGEAQLAGGRMQLKLAQRPVVVRGFAAIAGTTMIRHQSVSQSTDGIRIVGLEHRDDGIGRRLLGDLEFPRARAPRRCHVVLVQHRHAYLPQEKGMTIRSGSLRGHRSFRSDRIRPDWVISSSTIRTILSEGEECSGITLRKSRVLDQNDLDRSCEIDYLDCHENSQLLIYN